MSALNTKLKELDRVAALADGLDANVTPLVVVGIHDFLSKDLPAREEILSPWLVSQSLNMVYAWRGVGKTFLALNIAYAVATGGKFLTWKAEKPRKVLYIDGEMPGPALQERLAAIVKASEQVAGVGMLNLVTPDLQNACMPDLATTEGQDAIDATIGDSELIVIDNLSCLARRGGRENEAESWLSVAEWALSKRAQGKSVLFIHHAGKNGQQRGTSKREDLLDTVICLKRPPDYNPADGAVFEVHYEKARNLHGTETDPLEAKLEQIDGKQAWTTKPVEETTINRVVDLANEGLNQTEIANELQVNRSTVSRAYRKAAAQGLIKSKGDMTECDNPVAKPLGRAIRNKPPLIKQRPCNSHATTSLKALRIEFCRATAHATTAQQRREKARNKLPLCCARPD